MRIITAIMLLCMAVPAVAQKKQSATSSLDVDRLYAKYKGKESITLYTPQEEIRANIVIQYNEAGKPSAVILYGTYTSGAAITNIIESLTAAKEKAGYKHTSSDKSYLPGQEQMPEVLRDVVNVEVYQKGTQYAKYGPVYALLQDSNSDAKESFYFEVGDLRRQARGATQPFTF